MQALLVALGNKYFLWALIVIGALGFFQMRSCQNKENEKIQTYNRQLQGQLSDMERELQGANFKLGIAKSQLMTQKDLADKLKEEKEEVDKDFEAFKKKHDLIIKSKDKTIAKLEQQIHGGDTDVSVTPVDDGTVVISPDENGCSGIEDRCVISYSWQDTLKRFKLTDPDIFKKDNEIFESSQLFKVYGEIWEQQDGSLQIKRLVLREVSLGESGEYEPIPGGKADIIESKFDYHNPPELDLEESFWDLFKLRAIAVASITAFPDGGENRLGLGLEFFNWEGLGINTHTAFHFKDAEKIEQRLGIAYNPRLWDVDLNVGIGISVGTPFAHMFQDYSINADLIFYLNN